MRSRLLSVSSATLILLLGFSASADPYRDWERATISEQAHIAALLHGGADQIRNAASALEEYGGTEALPALRRAFADSALDARVRAASATALGAIGGRRVAPELEACLRVEAEPHIRSACVDGLARVGTRRAFRAVVDALSDMDKDVQSRAIDALANFAEPEGIVLLAQIATNDVVIDRARRAVGALGRSGMNEAVEPLLRLLDARPGLVPDVLEALERLGAPRARAILAERRDEAELQEHAALLDLAIAAGRPEGTLQTLIAMVSGENWRLATRRLVASKNTAAAPAILAFAEAMERQPRTEDGASRYWDLLRLAALLDPNAAADALFRAAAPRGTVGAENRAAAILFLGGVGTGRKSDIEAFLTGQDIIGDTNPAIRIATIQSLAMLRGAAASDRIRSMLDDGDSGVRAAAARLLGVLADRSSLARLLDALMDENADVRREAAIALGYIGDPAARARLLATAETESDHAVSAAIRFAMAALANP